VHRSKALFSLGSVPAVVVILRLLFPVVLSRMIEIPSEPPNSGGGIARIGSQPIALAAGALILMVVGVGGIALWRGYTGNTPEQDRIVAARQLQARAAQASEQLVEKTKGLEETQQESIDQLQVVQDQLQTTRRVLAFQQAETKRLSEQVSALTEAVESLRHSFASAQGPEASATPSQRNKAVRTRSQAARSAHRRARSKG
jgi:hypothetical protein